VDVVAGRTGSSVIWLIEVKDPTDVFVVPEIRRHLDRFYVTRGKEKAYIEQLVAKYEDLRSHADVVAATLKLPAATRVPYEIRPLFITRRPVPGRVREGQCPLLHAPGPHGGSLVAVERRLALVARFGESPQRH